VALEELFDAMIQENCEAGSPGCLMVNSMVERAPHDASTRALAFKHAREVERMLATRLNTAQRRGEIAKGQDPSALARFLYHTILGLSVASRALGEQEELQRSARLALQAVK
jgi:TetR/AcrR family transcriptional repressor of nem operon